MSTFWVASQQRLVVVMTQSAALLSSTLRALRYTSILILERLWKLVYSVFNPSTELDRYH